MPVYVINEDATISTVPRGATGDRPWFVSPTAAVIHGGVRMTCFTKEGIGAEPFPNPSPDPLTVNQDEEPERHHYYVEMTDGVLHIPPLPPVEAALFSIALEEEGSEDEFEYDAEWIFPVL